MVVALTGCEMMPFMPLEKQSSVSTVSNLSTMATMCTAGSVRPISCLRIWLAACIALISPGSAWLINSRSMWAASLVTRARSFTIRTTSSPVDATSTLIPACVRAFSMATDALSSARRTVSLEAILLYASLSSSEGGTGSKSTRSSIERYSTRTPGLMLTWSLCWRSCMLARLLSMYDSSAFPTLRTFTGLPRTPSMPELK
mmetsp:Transcript_27860/g.65726  ORF Transcript_27860/g.65726 Transcript_27860/m.65726 type:complete len:201 (+) Transcript_27860:388-990(+)